MRRGLLEVFRKRALYGGAGMKRASVSAEQCLKEWLWAETYPQGSVSINLALRGFAASDLSPGCGFRAEHRPIARSAVTRCRTAARWVSYGTGCLRYHLEHQPGQRVSMHEYLDESEHAMLGIIGSPELLEPMIIISGGGFEKDQIKAGRVAVSRFIKLAMREYFERLDYAGLEGRAHRSRIPHVLERIQVA